jgi:hypothetical protein
MAFNNEEILKDVTVKITQKSWRKKYLREKNPNFSENQVDNLNDRQLNDINLFNEKAQQINTITNDMTSEKTILNPTKIRKRNKIFRNNISNEQWFSTMLTQKEDYNLEENTIEKRKKLWDNWPTMKNKKEGFIMYQMV